tara:strand:- start:1610 stop:1963 length:354 start_codon:yes stop_codon:yes gene_type:complete
MRKLYKKGISPLVATILLIAFAVSIGATVMSFGGVYYEKYRGEKVSCSKSLISTFELEDKEQCRNYEFKSILNFYSAGEDVETPECYKETGTGKGDLCSTSEKVFDNTWIPTKITIK